ncbi:MAG: AbrB/MazE/SpoVT family DNA-binding domain-containing protein [Nanoarchaeota archaeon]|nr:AbrB/MazE/SpoVT family DNA-binding domain-containing protein [Nanoarchaeota archaeon]
MERKLVKQGRNALTVTLPAKWLKQHGLGPGGSIFMQERNHEVVIQTQPLAEKREITLQLAGVSRSMFFHQVTGRYIEGFDRIILMHDNPLVAQEVPETLLGMIIEEHSATRTVLKSVIAVPDEDFLAILRRYMFILLQQANNIGFVAQVKASLELVKKDELLLNCNLFYCLRYLNKYMQAEKSYNYFLLCATLEEAGDQLKVIAKHIGKNVKLADIVVKGVEGYVVNLFQKDVGKVYASLRLFRDAVPQKSFVDGLVFSLAETLYNNIGYLHPAKE